MANKMNFNKDILLDNIDTNKISISDSNYSNIFKQEAAKLENKCYEIFKKQCMDWKNTVKLSLEHTNNRSILLYMIFVTVEIYLKAEFARCFGICSFNGSSVISSNLPKFTKNEVFSLNNIKHRINECFNYVENNRDNKNFDELKLLLSLNGKLKNLDLNTVIGNNYTDLRYNCTTNGDYLFVGENNIITEDEKNKIWKVLENVEL